MSTRGTVTKKQVQFIKGLARDVFPSDDAYRAWLGQTWGVESCTHLSKSRAITAIDQLKAMQAGEPVPDDHRGRYHGAGQAGYAWRLTPDQADEIARLQDELGWDIERLARLIAKQTRQTTPTLPSSLTKRQASTVLSGMNRVLADRNTETA